MSSSGSDPEFERFLQEVCSVNPYYGVVDKACSREFLDHGIGPRVTINLFIIVMS